MFLLYVIIKLVSTVLKSIKYSILSQYHYHMYSRNIFYHWCQCCRKASGKEHLFQSMTLGYLSSNDDGYTMMGINLSSSPSPFEDVGIQYSFFKGQRYIASVCPRGVLSTSVCPGTCRWNGSQNQPPGITMTPYTVQKLLGWVVMQRVMENWYDNGPGGGALVFQVG